MRNLLLKICFAGMILAYFFLSEWIYAQNENDIEYKFTRVDSSYSFLGSFKVNADPDCLLGISFDFDHIRALALDAKNVELVEHGSNWNRISYTYQKFIFFENKSVWFRKINLEKQRVDFTLVSSENNKFIMPQMLSSSGYYQIKPQGEYSVIEYYQQCILSDEVITKLYLNQVKKEAIKFIYKFSEYANKICGFSKIKE